jgi:hypothetical protein
MTERSEGDALEQAQPVDPHLEPRDDEPTIGDDVPEADALEQAQEVPEAPEP